MKKNLKEFIKSKNISSVKAKKILSNYHEEEIMKRNFQAYSFLLYVDYSDKITKLIKLGNYSSVDDRVREISSKKFKNYSSGLKKMKLFYFAGGMRNKEIIRRIKEEGFRPANEIELLSFSYKYPAIQKQNAIVALDALDCKKERKIKVYHLLYVYKDEVEVDISLYGWDNYVVFLGVEED
jgi:hypothetical protein